MLSEIIFQGNCTIQEDSRYGIYLSGGSSIAVKGTLKIEEASDDSNSSGIYMVGGRSTIPIEKAGRLEIESKGKGVELGSDTRECQVKVNGSLTINAGSDGIGVVNSNGRADIALNLGAGSSLKIDAGTGYQAISVEQSANPGSSSLNFDGLPAYLSLTGGISGIEIPDNADPQIAELVKQLNEIPRRHKYGADFRVDARFGHPFPHPG